MNTADITADLRSARDNLLGERHILIHAMAHASRHGLSAKEIARLVTPAFGRDQVLQYLAVVALHDAADKALVEAGLDDFVDVSVTGIDAPREARLNLVADPAETPDFATLPGRIRDALRDFLITLDVSQGYPLGEDYPKGGDERVLAGFVDEVLLDGEPVRLARIEPRA
ncbi:hypothetical protein [Streptomyces sp. CBMA156]|uniref:hypothetical protein n=1 Tax=Streptomyces sp. CBMA156 TaxID=1930280 RepID=UPI0016618DBB|nr:hypothetical protein [Streptomyces sp. CBMA156]MBD0673897.1 hypothetical protein [Streptomyces sp. CBMA156]